MYRKRIGEIYRKIATGLVATVLAAGGFTPLLANETGTVRGTVTLEESGDFIRGAVVVVIGSGDSALTDNEGRFEIDGIPAGEYEVLAQREHLTAGRQTVIVESGGTATANFVLSLSPLLEDLTVTASPVGTETSLEAFNSVSTVHGIDIVRESGGDLATTIESEPGVALRGFGPGSNRPIIRGFDGDRVLILQDGIRAGDLSAESGDHGVAIDPYGAERIEIVRGPATLLYGSNAVGGVVNVITPHASYRESLFDGTRAQLSADLGTANAQAGANAGLQFARNGAHFWAGGGRRHTNDYTSPEGIVENTATESTSARAGAGWAGDRFFTSAGVKLNDGRYGVPFAGELHSHGHHEEEPGGHEDDHDMEEPGEHGETAIALDWQYRGMHFDFGFQNLANRVVEKVQFSLNFNDWQHNELEIEGGSERVGTRFENRSYIARADVFQRQTGRLSGRFGAWARVRDFEAAGFEALAPQTDLGSFAAFAYQELSFGRFRLQFGGRVERDNYQVAERTGGHGHEDEHEDEHDEEHEEEHEDEHEEHDEDEEHDEHGEENEDEHDDHEDEHGEDHPPIEAPDPRDRKFVGASASVGLHTRLGGGNALVTTLTRSHRAPAIEEMYNFGPHVGTLSFDVGNPDLDPESTVGLDVSLRHRGDHVRGELNFFVYEIGNFIFGNRSGQELDGLPVYNILQGDSRFVGFDARGSVRLAGRTWATLGLGRVDADLTTTGEALPRIPPLQGTLRLDVPYRGFTLSPRVVFAARQGEVFRGETPTDGYTRIDVRGSYVWPRERTAHVLSFAVTNLTDELYRNHTSYIKDRGAEMGRAFRVTYGLRFH